MWPSLLLLCAPALLAFSERLMDPDYLLPGVEYMRDNEGKKIDSFYQDFFRTCIVNWLTGPLLVTHTCFILQQLRKCVHTGERIDFDGEFDHNFYWNKFKEHFFCEAA